MPGAPADYRHSLWRMMQRQLLRSTEPRFVLRDLYSAAVAASAPGPVLETALDRCVERRTADAVRDRVWIVAIGKAALPMADAAVGWLRRRHLQPVGGVIVAPEPGTPPHASIRVAVGDHPEPGPRSFTAAARVGEVCARVR